MTVMNVAQHNNYTKSNLKDSPALRIGLLEDDPDQAEVTSLWLEDQGHHCIRFSGGRDLIRALRSESFDLLLLDWLVPDMSGLEVLHWVRNRYEWKIPIIFVSRLGSEEDVVQALEAGADDYMEKPLRRMELLARINALVRRMQVGKDASGALRFDPYLIDVNTRAIRLRDEWISLTQKEYELAVFLFRNAGRALSRGHILDSVWGTRPDLNTRTVDTHVSRLRKKLHLTPDNGWVLSSIYQHGYRLEPVRHAEEDMAHTLASVQ